MDKFTRNPPALAVGRFKHIPYSEIPEATGPEISRHGILRNQLKFTLEIWFQGRLIGEVSASFYMSWPSQTEILQGIAGELRPLWDNGTPWQRVRLKQLFIPWAGDAKVW
jgi:hypothetical protein